MIQKKQITIKTYIEEYVPKLNHDTFYQRNYVWPKNKVGLLADSILKGYDLPKFYLHENGIGYDVVDGQQRTKSLIAFVGGNQYNELDDEDKERFLAYKIDVVIYDESTPEEDIRRTFFRLQQGMALNAPEQRRSFDGKFPKEAYDLSQNSFFNLLKVGNGRYVHEEILTRFVIFAIHGGAAKNNKGAIDAVYEDNKDGLNKDIRADVVWVMNFISDGFKKSFNTEPKLETWQALVLFLAVLEFKGKYAVKADNIDKDIVEAFLDLTVKVAQAKEGAYMQCPEAYSLLEVISDGTDNEERLNRKLEPVIKYIVSNVDDLKGLDPQRFFTAAQRMALFNRDQGICQITGEKLTTKNFHCDHIVAWIKGGRTTLENGRVTTASANSSKGMK